MELSLHFDNPSRSYSPGSEVSGSVIVVCHSNYKSQGLSVRLAGREQVEWRESHNEPHYNSSTKKQEYQMIHYNLSGNETLLENEIRLAGDGSTTFTFLPGRYQYPFRFILPPALPSDFSGTGGSISYEVEAIIKRSWYKFNDKTAAQIHVVPMYDLNENPDARAPGQATDSKMVCCLCCASGPITATLKLSHKGYVPGEFINGEVDVQNLSSRDVNGIKLSIIQEYNFKASRIWAEGQRNDQTMRHYHDKTKTVSNVIATVERGGVAPGASDVWNGRLLRVPPARPTTRGSHIINFWYNLHLELQVSGAVSLKISLPIYIGTVPLQSFVEQNAKASEHKLEPKKSHLPIQHPSHAPVHLNLRNVSETSQ